MNIICPSCERSYDSDLAVPHACPLCAFQLKEIKWLVRRGDMAPTAYNKISSLKLAILSDALSPDDQISMRGQRWLPISAIPELSAVFNVVREEPQESTGVQSYYFQSQSQSQSDDVSSDKRSADDQTTPGPPGDSDPPIGIERSVHAGGTAKQGEKSAIFTEGESSWEMSVRAPRTGRLLVLLLVITTGLLVLLYLLINPGDGGGGSGSGKRDAGAVLGASDIAGVTPAGGGGADAGSPVHGAQGDDGQASTAAVAPEFLKRLVEVAADVSDHQVTLTAIRAMSVTKIAKKKSTTKKKSWIAKKNSASWSGGASGVDITNMDFDTLLKKGKLYLGSEKAAKALSYLLRAQGMKPGRVDVLVYLARAYVKLHKVDDAIKTLQDAMSANPNYGPVYIDLGDLYLKKGLKEKALGYFKSYLIKFPSGSQAGHARKRISLFSGQ